MLHHRRRDADATTSTPFATTAVESAQRALAEHLHRCRIRAQVIAAPRGGSRRCVKYALPSPRPCISVIVPTRNQTSLLRRCVEGVLSHTGYPNLQLVILDNDSNRPEALQYLASLSADARICVVAVPGPFNFSAMMNEGVRNAAGELVCLLNNDVVVIDPEWLDEVAGHGLRPGAGAVGAKLLYPDDTIQHAGIVTGLAIVAGYIHRRLPRFHPGRFGRLELVQEVSCVTAACPMTRKSVFEEVGGFDGENLAVAHNDADFCLRLRSRGYRIVWTPFPELYHLESASRGPEADPRDRERRKQEIAYMLRRWGAALPRDPFYNPNLGLDHTNAGLVFPPRIEKPWGAASARRAVSPKPLTGPEARE